MIQAIFKFLMDLLATVIQIIVWPINAVITATLPDLSDKIESVAEVFATVFNTITWATGLIPTSIIGTIVFILTVEIAKHTIFTSTHTLLKVWNVLQKIKFW